MNTFRILELGRQIKGTNDRIEFFKKHQSDQIKYVFEQAVSPYITFGIKKFEFAPPITSEDFNINSQEAFDTQWKAAVFMLHLLATRSATGSAALSAIEETTAKLNVQQQAVLRMILNKDLRSSINVKFANKVFPGLINEFQVQLASDKLDKIEYPCVVEIKYNGRRNVAFVNKNDVQHYSRNGRLQSNFSCFDRELVGIAAGIPMVFDGEVIGVSGDHTEKYTASQKQARRKKDVDTSNLAFVIFDMMPLSNFKRQRNTMTYVDRRGRLKAAYKNCMSGSKLEVIRTRLSRMKKIKDEGALHRFYDIVVQQGEEGLIAKNLDSEYEFKRSHHWVKLKPVNTMDLVIVDVKEGEKGREGTLGSVIVQKGDVTVNCPMGKGITHKQSAALWKVRKKLIGKMAEIQYMNETDAGSLYLPKFLQLRDDKE